MATTPTAVRDALATSIAALTPTSESSHAFTRYTKGLPFAKWAEQNPAHCFRTFQIRFSPAPRSPAVVNGTSGRWRVPFSLEVAYPREHFQALDLPQLDLDQAIEEDTAKLIPVLRDYAGASYVAEEAAFVRVPDVEDDDSDAKTTLLRFGAVFEMWRDV